MSKVKIYEDGAEIPVKSASVEAVKILPDGTRIPLGVIAYANRNPFKQAWWDIKQFFSRRRV